MACIKKLAGNITYDCAKAAEPVSIRGIEELILVNYDDISNYSVDTVGRATITMKEGTRGYVVSSVGNSVSATIAAKVNDIITTAQEHSVVVRLLDNGGTGETSDGYILVGMVDALQNGSYAAFTKTTLGQYYVYGLMSSLECSEIAGDSATDGTVSVTLKTPDSAGGDRMLVVSQATYDGLKTPKV